jgi:uncharacterized protein (TIGR02147 family)
MVSVFDYSDFIQYLKEAYRFKKHSDRGYSFQQFANDAGYPDKSCVHAVIAGRRKLPREGVVKIAQALKLSESETDSFDNLVSFNQAKSQREKTYYFNKLIKIKKRGPGATVLSEAQVVRKDHFEFFSKWYHVAIRAIIGYIKFKGDYQDLAKRLSPPVTPKEAKKSVQLLTKLGLIKKKSNGVYVVTEPNITTGKDDNIRKLGLANFHMDCTDLAKRAIDIIHRDERNITGLTVGISKYSYERICQEIQEFQARISQIAINDKDADRVYQINFHVFPMSETLEKDETEE